MLDKLRKETEKKLEENRNNLEMLYKYKSIYDMLQYDDCFMEMSYDVACSILSDLGVRKENINRAYLMLASKDF